MSNEKAVTIFLILGLIKKTFYKNEPILSKLYHDFGGNVKVESDMSIYVPNADFKKTVGADTSKLAP